MIYSSEHRMSQYTADDLDHIKRLVRPGRLTQKLLSIATAAAPYFHSGVFPAGIDMPVEHVIACIAVMETHDFDAASDVCRRCGLGRMVIFNNGTECTGSAEAEAPARKVAVVDDFDAIRAARDRIRAEEAATRRLAEELERLENGAASGDTPILGF